MQPIPSRMSRSRFSPSRLRTSFRRSSSTSTTRSSSCSSSSNSSSGGGSSSPVHTINSVLSRQPSIVDMEAEKRWSGPELNLLEPRPLVYWAGLDERILGSL